MRMRDSKSISVLPASCAVKEEPAAVYAGEITFAQHRDLCGGEDFR